MQCNIDSRGQTVRRIWGVICVIAATTLAAFAFFTGPWWLYILACLALAGGLFAFWEARKKWCAIRAIGFKTPV